MALSDKQPAVERDRVVLRDSPSSRLLVFAIASDVAKIDGRGVLSENIIVGQDGTVLVAVDDESRTEVVRVLGERVLYVGSRVRAITVTPGWTGTIFRVEPVSMVARWE